MMKSLEDISTGFQHTCLAGCMVTHLDTVATKQLT